MSGERIEDIDLSFDLAAALAELVLLIDEEARTTARPLTPRAASLMGEARAALVRFHESMERFHESMEQQP